MNVSINSNYQTNFSGAKGISLRDAKQVRNGAVMVLALGTAANGVTNPNKGMSAEELQGRVQVTENPIKPNIELFNQEVSFNYFANGKLKNVLEYIKIGKEGTAELDDYDKENKLNTLEYQEKIVDKILSEETLINNKGIRENLYYMINYDYNYFLPDTKEETQEITNYFDNKTEALIKVLDAYAKDINLQNNTHINKYINDYARFMNNDEQANMLIELLTQNANNDDKEFFDNLDGLVRNNIQPDLIRKVQSDKKLYDKLNSFILYNINGTDKVTADKIIQILDNYEENYTDSDLVTEKIGDVLWKSFDYKQKENPVKFASNMMKELAEKETATKSETASQLCERLASKLAGIEKGEYDDADKTDMDNVNKRINMIREIRTEIKDNAGKYTDKNSKEALSWTLGTVIAKLELMKHVREHMGWAITGYGEVTDEAVNNEIREMLK